MLKIEHDRLVWWPVTVNRPVDGGGVDPVEVEVRFRLPDRATLARIATGVLGGDAATAAALIEDWRGFADEAGEVLPCTPSNVAAVLAIPCVEHAVALALIGCARGVAAKNSGRG